MMRALGQINDMEKFKELFYTTINHDLLFQVSLEIFWSVKLK